MSMFWVIFLVIAQSVPTTVGDTVWVTTRVPLAPRQILRAQTWDLGDIGQVLGPPVVDYVGDSAIVRYPVTLWYPGVHALSVPGPIVVSPEGRSDTLDARPVSVAVATVLPLRIPRDSLRPRDPAAVLPQAERTVFPLAVLGLLVAALASGITWLRRISRRRLRPALGPTVKGVAVAPMLLHWGRAGETRAAAEGWSQLIHARLASGPPDDGGRALAAALDEIGFQPGTLPVQVDQLLDQAAAWLAARDRAP
jgi:hypothetical protein